MQIFWAVIVSLILALIIYGIISAKIAAKLAAKKPIAIGDLPLARLSGVFDPARLYLVVTNAGTKFDGVKFVGYTDPGTLAADIGIGSHRWLVLESADGKRIFVDPFRILWVKEV